MCSIKVFQQNTIIVQKSTRRMCIVYCVEAKPKTLNSLKKVRKSKSFKGS